jgi:hypothetical protein
MALGYDEWKSKYENLDAATKQRYDEMSKNDKAYQEYSTRYMNEKNASSTPTQTNTTPVNNTVNNVQSTTNNNSKTSGSTVTNNKNTNTGSTISNNTPLKND